MQAGGHSLALWLRLVTLPKMPALLKEVAGVQKT